MNILEKIKTLPERIKPTILTRSLNEQIVIASEGLLLRVGENSQPDYLDGELHFNWIPSSSVEFTGKYKGSPPSLEEENCALLIPEIPGEIPVMLTNISISNIGFTVRGVLKGEAVYKTRKKADRVKFHLANFPDYLGQPIRTENMSALTVFRGRFTFENQDYFGTIDAIPETKALRKEHNKKGGFFVSHVGEIKPKNNCGFTAKQINSICLDLYFYFSFCRGARTDLIFPIGLFENDIVWKQYAPWSTGTPRKVTSWFPTLKLITKCDLFPGFIEKFNNSTLRIPLIHAIHWYVEANKPESIDTTRIVLTQVALEMLAWSILVELKKKYSPNKFKKLAAEEKLRNLLLELKIPTTIPNHLDELQKFTHKSIQNMDAPGIFTSIRNAYVHSTPSKRKVIDELDGLQLWQLAQMSIGMLELVILAICNYSGYYAQRGWRQYKGDDEVKVPWI